MVHALVHTVKALQGQSSDSIVIMMEPSSTAAMDPQAQELAISLVRKSSVWRADL